MVARRVLQLVHTMDARGGVPHSVWNIVRALRAHTSWFPVVLAGRYPGGAPTAGLEVEGGHELHILPVWQPLGGRMGPSLAYPLGYVRSLRQLAARVDVVHVHGVWTFSSIVGCPVLRSMGKPYILSPRGFLDAWPLAHKGLKKRVVLSLLERRNLNGAARLHASSEAEKESLLRLGLRAPIFVSPNGIEPDAQSFFSQVTSTRPLQKAASPARTLLYVSRLHPQKRTLELVRIFSRLAAEYPQWRLRLAGSDDYLGYRAQLEREIRAAGLSERVSFLGFLAGRDLWEAYAQADLFALPTMTESFGNVIVESLAAGVPVITTKGAPWSVLCRAGCGWWVNLDLGAFEAALREAMGLPVETLQEMGERGRTLVRERFTWQSIIGAMGAQYEEVAGEARAA